MINIVLVEPEIPQNTGNVARTCAVTGSRLHLVKPLGFELDDAKMRRAGLDYWHLLDVEVHESLEAYLEKYGGNELWLATTRAERKFNEAEYTDGCHILLGRETAGLPAWLLERYPERCVRIPQKPVVRCLNLSNAAAVMCYEALRRLDYPGMD